MKMVIYGLPCAGKDTLISKIEFATHVKGSQWLNECCGGKFRSLDPIQQNVLRKQFARFIKESTDNIVVDGHFAFPSEGGFTTVFTNDDADCYDVFAFLDTAPDVILKRIKQSEKNTIYSDLTVEEIRSWRDFEVNNLCSECYKMGKEFIILDPRYDCILEFLEGLFNGDILTSPEVSRIAADRILKSTDKKTIVLCDGDKTLSNTDLSLSLDLPRLIDLKEVFNGDRYTTFQFWVVYKIYRDLPQLDTKMREAAARVQLSRPLLDDLSKIDSYRVVVTAGLENLWAYAIKHSDLFEMAIGTDVGAIRNMSQFGKAFIVRYLHEAGRKVIALGDNMVDYRMLLEADQGYVIAHLKKNASLQRTLLDGSKLRQPSSNEIKFEGVKEVNSIHEDIE